MKQRQRKHVYLNRMRSPESDRAAERRVLRELREMREDFAVALAADAIRGHTEVTFDVEWEQMPAQGREWPNEGWDERPMTPREAGMAAGLYNYPDGYYQNVVRYIIEDPDIMGGVACFRGSRVPIHAVLASLEKGISWRRIRASWPFLTREHVAAARAYAVTRPRKVPIPPTKGRRRR